MPFSLSHRLLTGKSPLKYEIEYDPIIHCVSEKTSPFYMCVFPIPRGMFLPRIGKI